MRKIVLVLSIFAALQANAQNYLITFTGTGAATTVASVKVENLTSGTSLTLNGSDILRLSGSVGIPALVNSNSQEMKIYPNPMNGSTTVELFAPVAGDAAITVYEMTGKTIVQVHSYLENCSQEFKLSGLKNGLYLINVTGNAYQFSGKLLCNGAEDGLLKKIEKIDNSNISIDKQFSKKDYNETQATIDMPYTAGDRLKFTAISGNFSTVKTDILTQDKILTFKFIPCKDADNYNYSVVEIGTQTWMVENLKTTHYRNGNAINNVSDNSQWIGLTTGAYCDYQNLSGNSTIYGKLYNFHAVNDSRNIAPVGWHIATDAEWKTLTTFLGGKDIAGAKMKETGASYWPNPNINATNESGFTALPGGSRFLNDGSFDGIGGICSFWTNSPDGALNGFELDLLYNTIAVAFYTDSRKSGYSVRCIKDTPVTGSVTDINGNVSKTVTIDTQVWMAENLKVTKYNDGTDIPLAITSRNWEDGWTTGSYTWYMDDIQFRNTYGPLYSGYSVTTGKLCPTGWHVPTDAEWTKLTTYLGGETVAGDKLKESGDTHWFFSGFYSSATNESGFTALPGGYCNNTLDFSENALDGYWWSSTEDIADGGGAWFYRQMDWAESSVYRSSMGRTFGYSVRCLKNY